MCPIQKCGFFVLSKLRTSFKKAEVKSRNFYCGGRTRICGEAYSVYVATGNPRRTPYSAKKTIYGWTLLVICAYAL